MIFEKKSPDSIVAAKNSSKRGFSIVVDEEVHIDGLPLTEPLPHLPLPKCWKSLESFAEKRLLPRRISSIVRQRQRVLYVSAGSVNLLDVAVGSPDRFPLRRLCPRWLLDLRLLLQNQDGT